MSDREWQRVCKKGGEDLSAEPKGGAVALSVVGLCEVESKVIA